MFRVVAVLTNAASCWCVSSSPAALAPAVHVLLPRERPRSRLAMADEQLFYVVKQCPAAKRCSPASWKKAKCWGSTKEPYAPRIYTMSQSAMFEQRRDNVVTSLQCACHKVPFSSNDATT